MICECNKMWGWIYVMMILFLIWLMMFLIKCMFSVFMSKYFTSFVVSFVFIAMLFKEIFWCLVGSLNMICNRDKIVIFFWSLCLFVMSVGCVFKVAACLTYNWSYSCKSFLLNVLMMFINYVKGLLFKFFIIGCVRSLVKLYMFFLSKVVRYKLTFNVARVFAGNISYDTYVKYNMFDL